MGRIEAICISQQRGTPKRPISDAEFVEEWGIADDAHAGRWHRQVSILAAESIENAKEILPDISQGAFAENIITSGLDLREVGVGDRLQIGGEVILEITQLGKVCHEECEIQIATGDCIMPKEGLFARVLKGGIVNPGDPVSINRKVDKTGKDGD